MMIRGFLREMEFPHWLADINLYLGVLYLENYHLFDTNYKMPHRKNRTHQSILNSGNLHCPCSQTIEYRTEREEKLKLQLH